MYVDLFSLIVINPNWTNSVMTKNVPLVAQCKAFRMIERRPLPDTADFQIWHLPDDTDVFYFRGPEREAWNESNMWGP